MLVSIYCSYTAVLISSKTKEGTSDKVDLTSAGGLKAVACWVIQPKGNRSCFASEKCKALLFPTAHTYTHLSGTVRQAGPTYTII